MRRYEQVPHPFVLRLEECVGLGCVLRIHLIGRANNYLPLVVAALRQAACSGNGVAHNRLRLEAIHQESVLGSGDWRRIDRAAGVLAPLPPISPVLPPCPPGVEIRLLTPMRAKSGGLLANQARFDFGTFFSTLLRRISMLTYFHGDTALDTDFKGLTTAARTVRFEGPLEWRDQVRYSARQIAAMKLGGVVGVLRIEGQDLSRFWPYLWLGQWTHAGAGATMGNGAYELASLPSPASPPCAGTLPTHETTGTAGADERIP